MSGRVFFLPAPATASIGGKATNLGRLMGLGAPVPAALVVAAEAFDDALARPTIAALVAAVEENPADRGARLARLRAALEAEPLDEALAAELATAAAGLPPGPLAVRSSAAGEDSAAHSFAGQHDTVLGVAGTPALAAAVRHCWASAFSERAVGYRERHGLDRRAARMAVVVQRLVAADVSGVMFTCDPTSGDRNTLVVEAVRGLGEALVAGRAAPERWTLDRATIALIDHAAPDGGAGASLLDETQLAELARLGLQVEAALGGPQDLEFAYENSRLQLLQTRPVTSRLATPGPEDRVVWSNTNIGELAPDVATPMTLSVVRAFVDFLIDPLRAQLGAAGARLDFVGLVAGRIYINMNATVALLRCLPGMKRKGYADFFGGDVAALGPAMAALTEAELPPIAARPWRLLWRLPRLLWRLARSLRMDVGEVVRGLCADTARMAGLDPRGADDEELLRRAGDYLPKGSDAIILGFLCVSSAQFLTKLCQRWFGDADGSIANRLLAGSGGMDSAEAGLDLWRLALAARESPVGDEIAAGRSWADVREALAPTARGAAFLRDWDRFMERHGHHTRAEIDVALPRWREQPDYVLGLVRGYVASAAARSPLELHRESGERRERMAAECRARLGPLRRRVFDALYARARAGLALREGAKSDFVRRIATLRRNLLEVGRRLAERGALAAADDVFFLSSEETAAALRQRPAPRLQATVAGRRGEYVRFAAITPPPVVVGRFDPARHQPPPIDPAVAVLRGVAVSAGRAVGPARVILRADDQAQVLPGEILIAPFTDPGWTPYFLPAAAIVMDLGGMLSHGSVVARELGVPAVVNVGPATRLIRTGQLVSVDAFRGEVRLLAGDGEPG